MFNDTIKSLIRTFTPAIVTLVATFFALDDSTSTALTVGLNGLFFAIYYTLIRALETNIHPAFGWFLGSATAPAYDKSKPNPLG